MESRSVDPEAWIELAEAGGGTPDQDAPVDLSALAGLREDLEHVLANEDASIASPTLLRHLDPRLLARTVLRLSGRRGQCATNLL